MKNLVNVEHLACLLLLFSSVFFGLCFILYFKCLPHQATRKREDKRVFFLTQHINYENCFIFFCKSSKGNTELQMKYHFLVEEAFGLYGR